MFQLDFEIFRTIASFIFTVLQLDFEIFRTIASFIFTVLQLDFEIFSTIASFIFHESHLLERRRSGSHLRN